MNCTKCGREIEEDQVFCAACLEEMAQYPVNPGTAVHIPSHKPEPESKMAKLMQFRHRTPAEQIRRLKKRVAWLRALVVVLVLICGALVYVVSRTVEELDVQRLLGQNYNTAIQQEQTQDTQTAPSETAP